MQTKESKNVVNPTKKTKPKFVTESNYKRVNREVRRLTGSHQCFVPGYN